MKGLAAGTKRLRGRGLGSALATSGTDALIFAIQLLQSVLTARALLPEGRGQLTTILIWPAFIFGFIAGGMRFTIIYFVGTYPEKRETVIWFGYVATVTLATLAAVFNYALAGLLLTDSDELVVALVQIAGIFQPLLAVTTYASILLQAERRYKIWNAFRILDPLLFTIGVAVALLLGHADLLTITVIFLAARVPILLAMLPFVKLAKEGRAWDGSLFREMAVYFSKVLPTGWMAQANAQLDQMVLSVFFRPELLGFYRVAVSSSGVVRFIAMGFQRTIMSDTASARDPAVKLKRSRDAAIMGFGLTLLALIPMLLMLRPLIVWAYGPAFEPAVAPAQVLLFAAAMRGLCSILNNAMRGLGKPLIPLLAEGLGAVATVVLLFALLPIFEMLGAAYTTLAATAVTAGILIYFFKRYSRHHAS